MNEIEYFITFILLFYVQTQGPNHLHIYLNAPHKLAE